MILTLEGITQHHYKETSMSCRIKSYTYDGDYLHFDVKEIPREALTCFNHLVESPVKLWDFIPHQGVLVEIKITDGSGVLFNRAIMWEKEGIDNVDN
jgi:hypothetical protein